MIWSKFTGREITLQKQSIDHDFINVNVTFEKESLDFVLPAAPNLKYHFISRKIWNKIIVTSSNANVKGVGFLSTTIIYFMNIFVYKNHRKILLNNIILGTSGPRTIRKQFKSFVAQLRLLHSNRYIKLLTTKELWVGWSTQTVPAVTEKVELDPKNKAVIICHLYYMDVLDEIAAIIRSRHQQFDVIITIPFENEIWRGRIVEFIPGARILSFENIGRDVRPFLKVLESGLLDEYSLICKIHTKKSSGDGRARQAGEFWRRRLLLDLLGAQKNLTEILEKFATDPSVGMIGSTTYRCPGPIFDEKVGWSANRLAILALAARMGVKQSEYKLDFFAGTMFWVRSAALQPLRQLALADTYFKPERGLVDGGPEHAVERIFGASVLQAGFRLEDVDCLK